jgi:serine phosphatase RsbU (regulator of sigma subunit)
MIMATFLTAVLIILQIIALIRYVERTNRELKQFFQSIEHADFTRSSTIKNMGKSFDELSNSFSKVTNRFLKLRSEKEESFQYLQTLVQHVGIGVISFRTDGGVELINNAAKKLLGITQLKKIHSLQNTNKTLADTLLQLKSGEKTLLKTGNFKDSMHLAIHATGFKLHAQMYTLVTLQNIQNEIERERMAKELEIARHVQESLLPKHNPNIPGFDISGICIPAKEVGGDYFDYLINDKNKLGIVIGDVSGKGVPAAIYMTLAKGIIQSHTNGDISPNEILVKVNNFMYQSIEPAAFVTLIFGLLNSDTGHLEIVRAGHNPAIHYSNSERKFAFVNPNGIGIALESGKIFQDQIVSQSIYLHSGDWMIFYTDGITEAMNDGLEEYGEERLTEVIQKNILMSAKEMISAVLDDIHRFTQHSEQNDDMTMIAIRATKE